MLQRLLLLKTKEAIIDNAVHFGGLIAGMAYAGIVFPKSSSHLRPSINITDRIVGSGWLVVIFFSSGLALLKIFSLTNSLSPFIACT